MKDELFGQLGDGARYDDEAFSTFILRLSCQRKLLPRISERATRLTSASSSARYASKVFARWSLLVKADVEDSAMMTSPILMQEVFESF